MHPGPNKSLLTIVSLVLSGLTIFLGYVVRRPDFQNLLLAYGAFFGLYVWIVFFGQKHFTVSESKYLWWLGIGLRVLLLFSIPNLSDDYARFLWDGRLSAAGIHPFAHTPAYFIQQGIFPPGITPDLFEKLNSPEYFTVYPPVCQAVFALGAWLSPSSDLVGVVVMKLFLLGCEIGTMFLLRRLSFAPLDGIQQRLVYALNPLAILEVSGNCHFEGAMVFFMLAGIAALQQDKLFKGALYWALATASKMHPVMFLPIVWRWLGLRDGFRFQLFFGMACLVLFAPIIPLLPHILESLDLYFRQFQFNASIYYLVREVGYAKIGWDIGEFSGPALGGITVLGILCLAIFTRPASTVDLPGKALSNFPSMLLFSMMLYLSLAATVQPWYAIVPLALSLLTRWRFAIAWSGLAILSYSHYIGGGFQEHYECIWVEYGVLWLFFMWEVLFSPRK